MKQPETAPRVVIMPSIVDVFLQMPIDDGNKFMRAVILYQYDGTISELDGLPKLVWTAIFPTLKATRQITLGRSKGGKASKRNNPNGRRGKGAAATDGDTAAEPSAGLPMDAADGPNPQRKVPPTLENIRGYIEVNRFNVDAEEFYNYYASRNWEIDGRKIGNVAALLRKWDKGGEWQKDYHEMRVLTGETERPAHLTPNEYSEAGSTVKLGYDERIDEAGRRTYGSGKTTVPNDAPPRPASGYEWSEPRHEWFYDPF